LEPSPLRTVLAETRVIFCTNGNQPKITEITGHVRWRVTAAP
jgi:hypothetical protein